jgi:hypothetical protein
VKGLKEKREQREGDKCGMVECLLGSGDVEVVGAGKCGWAFLARAAETQPWHVLACVGESGLCQDFATSGLGRLNTCELAPE